MARAVFIAAAFAFCVTAAGCAESPANPSSPSSPSLTSSPLPPSTSATLTGTVFETTPDGPRPVPGAYLNAIGGGGDSISAYADADGRYAFTNKQVGATVIVQAVGQGRVWVTDPSNWDGFPAAIKDVSVPGGDVVVEIDIP